MAHSLIHCNQFSCPFWWHVVFDCWSSGKYTHDLRRASREKELREFRQEAWPSRISPILWHVHWLFLLFAPRRWPSSPSSDSSMSSWSPTGQSWGLSCWPYHALLWAHRCCLAASSWDLSSNFIAQGLRWWGSLTCIFPSDNPLFSRMYAWRCVALVNRTRRSGPNTSEKSIQILAAQRPVIRNSTAAHSSQ